MRKWGIVIAIVTLLLDQASKQWVLEAYGQMPRFLTEVTSFFNLVLVWNRGISFGMFAQHPEWMPWMLTAMALAITAILGHWLAKATHLLTAAALGLIIGGALGNVIDRLRFGAVVDFLDFHLEDYHWPAFNLADSAIFIGVVLLVMESILVQNPRDDASENG